jgi:hypothetical protein
MGGEVELWQTVQSQDEEDQVALRYHRRCAARLKQADAGGASENHLAKVEKHQSFVQVTTPGILDKLLLKPVLRELPKAGEVEIEVKASGLNFMNVLSALGICPGYEGGVGPLGIECAGIVSRVGDGVSNFQVGDEVVGVAFNSLASHAVDQDCW